MTGSLAEENGEFLELLACHGVGLHVGQHLETEFHQLFRRLEGFAGVGKQVLRVGVDFQFQPLGAEGGAVHLGGEHGLFGIAHTRRVGQQHALFGDEVEDVLAAAVLRVEAFESGGHHLRAGGGDGLPHHLVGRELARPDEQARAKLTACND